MKKLWFKAKRYGWGWMPASWEGWLALTLYVLDNVLLFFSIDVRSHSVSDMLINFVPRCIGLTLLLLCLCYLKGERPHWR